MLKSRKKSRAATREAGHDAVSRGSSSAPEPKLISYIPTAGPPEELCEHLARSHYENFTVGSIFLPRQLRRHVHNIYAYCRISDDLADETGDPELSLRLLESWRDELHRCFLGKPRLAVFEALANTVSEFNLSLQPFDDLLDAFVQDQRVTRYETFDDLLGYCSRSANPVGRLFLCLLGYRDSARQKLSDFTCTALQLANFWQDVAIDYQKGRIYIPLEDMDRFGYTEYELRNNVVNPSYCRMMRFEIGRTRELFQSGAPLAKLISGVGAADVEFFTGGGLAVLRSIERHHYDVFRRRASVPKYTKFMLMLGWCARRAMCSLRKI